MMNLRTRRYLLSITDLNTERINLMINKLFTLLIIVLPTNEIRGHGVYWSHQESRTEAQLVIFCQIHRQFSRHRNKTCYTMLSRCA